MAESTKKLPDLSRRIIEVIEKEYDWSWENGQVLLQETKDLIVALEGLGYTGRQILAELVENGNIDHVPSELKRIDTKADPSILIKQTKTIF